MARAFEQIVNLHLAKLDPEQARRTHIAVARAGLAKFLARQSTKPVVTIEVDGRPVASEDAVKPFGVIKYRFTRMREVVRFAIVEAERLSPVRSGRYRRSWFAMVNRAEVGLDEIASNAEVIVTNDQPYSRKINVGAKGFERYVPPGIAEKVKELVKRRYGSIVDARVEFITLEGGHVLRHDQYRKDKHGRRGNVRRDARAGMDLTYPSIRLTPRY